MNNKGDKRFAGGSLRDILNALAVLSSMGIQFAVILAIFLYLGYVADEKFGTGDIFKIIGIVAGFPVGIYGLYKQLKQYKFI